MQLFASLVFPYHNTLFLSFYFLPLCRFCQYIAKIHVYFVIHFTKTITLERWGMPQNWLFVKKIFFAEFKCLYKASSIICLHKYVNNSIYVFEPKFTKSRPSNSDSNSNSNDCNSDCNSNSNDGNSNSIPNPPGLAQANSIPIPKLDLELARNSNSTAELTPALSPHYQGQGEGPTQP